MGNRPSKLLRRALHDRGHHRFCREFEVRVLAGRNFGPEFLVGKRPDGTEERIDTTVFGGRPVYRTEKRHG